MDTKLGRRTFVVTSLTTGFALAVSPVTAQTLHTDATGLVAGEIKIGEMPAYRAMPEGNAKFPMILVVPEIFGVHEHIKDVCRRLAKAGYMAIAPRCSRARATSRRWRTSAPSSRWSRRRPTTR
jgi:carboxymethylenebutenolidase